MPTTRFHLFSIAFADATSDAAPSAFETVGEQRAGGSNERRYFIEEQAAGVWKAWENGQIIALTTEQHDDFRVLLAALRPLPRPDIETGPPGEDGTWHTVVVRTEGRQQSYRWWSNPPSDWARLDAVAKRVQQLADIPRRTLAEQNRVVAQQFFDRLAARDVEGAMACCDASIEYSSPFFEGVHARRGVESVSAMWRAWLRAMTDARISCDDIRAGHEHAFAYWTARYTFPGTSRQVRQDLSADLLFAQGKIIRHRDRFGLHGWASQSYGEWGQLLGGQRAFQSWAASRERARLAAFEVAGIVD